MKNTSRYLTLGIGLLILGWLLYYFSDIVAYVLTAWVLAMIGQPLMKFFQKYLAIWKLRAGPNTAAALTLGVFFLVVWLLVSLFVPPIVSQINNLANVDYAAVAKALEPPLQNLQLRLVKFGILEPTQTLEQQFKETFSNWLAPAFIKTYIASLLSAAGSIMVGLASVVFITFFFLKEQGLFVGFVAALMPTQHETKVHNAMTDIATMLSRYFRGLALQMLIISVFVTLFLMIMGVKNALLIGVFAAILNLIHYVGPIIGALFGVVFTISSNLDLDFYTEMMPLLIKVLFVFAAAQSLDTYVLQPFIFSNSVLAHPVEIFIVVLMGAEVNGVIGMILAIPVYTVLRVIARSFLSKFNIVQHLTDRMKGVGSEG